MTIITRGPLIGPVLAAIRGAAGRSQLDLESRTGVDHSQISKYEGSIVVPSIDTAARLLAGLNHRLVVLPAQHAIRQKERQDVIDAARWLVDGETEPFTIRHQRLEEAITVLDAAGLDLPSANPYAEIAELRSRLEQSETISKRLRDALRLVRDMLSEDLR